MSAENHNLSNESVYKSVIVTSSICFFLHEFRIPIIIQRIVPIGQENRIVKRKDFVPLFVSLLETRFIVLLWSGILRSGIDNLE